MKYIIGILLILINWGLFRSNADHKNRHYLEYTSKQMKDFSVQQFVHLGLIFLGILIFFAH